MIKTEQEQEVSRLGRPAKTANVLKAEGKSHRTKAELAAAFPKENANVENPEDYRIKTIPQAGILADIDQLTLE